jgi:GTP-binding protein
VAQVAAEFVTSVAGPDQFPHSDLAEVALVGRSNVGKSSLINALVRQRLARTSASPGKTRLANYYRVQRGSSAAFFLVDLPGYGFAGREPGPGPGRARRGGDPAVRGFTRAAEAVFGRAGRLGVLLLVDARHPGLRPDLDAWAWLAAQGCRRRVVGTKADKLSRAERATSARRLLTSFDVPVPLVSARTGEGLDELWKLIANLTTARQAPP